VGPCAPYKAQDCNAETVSREFAAGRKAGIAASEKREKSADYTAKRESYRDDMVVFA